MRTEGASDGMFGDRAGDPEGGRAEGKRRPTGAASGTRSCDRCAGDHGVGERPSPGDLTQEVPDPGAEPAEGGRTGPEPAPCAGVGEIYRTLVEESFDGILIQKGPTIVFANRRLYEMLAYDEGELLGMDHWRIYHPDYQALTRERARVRLRGEDVIPRFEVKLLRKDGSWFHGEISAKAVCVEEEPGIQVWVRDITERRQAEEALRRSEKRLRELFDAVTDLVYTQDLEGRFLSANRAMTDLFGYAPGDFLGRRASDFMKPELRPFFESEYLTGLRQCGRYRGISVYFGRTGQKIYLEYSSALVRPEEGDPYISGIARDVTERVRTERALQEREERIRAILQAAPNPIVVYDTQGHPLFVNPAFTHVFGWTLKELRGRQIPFVPEDEREKTMARIRSLYLDDGPGMIETRRTTRDGRLLDVLVSAALIRGHRGLPSGTVVSFTDLTDKRRMEAGLIQAQRREAVGLVAGGLAHDFNNLLMAIQGNISMMMVDRDASRPFLRRLKDMEAYIQQGATLTRQLLGFARGGRYEVRTLSLNDVIKEHNQVFGRTHKEIVIREALAEDVGHVAADESQMRQILMNLYVNAADAMPEGGSLSIATRNTTLGEDHGRSFEITPGPYVHVSVTDTGCGMDKATQERIFEPFFTTKETGRGNGLGLASVYGIVKNHGGFVEVESELGKGSTFHLYLPAHTPDQGGEGTEVGGLAANGGEDDGVAKGRGTILVVDDEEMVRDVAEEMLRVLGYRVLSAASAADAITLFEGHRGKIDLVLLDLIMPDVGGGQLFDSLRSLDPEIKVLLASGYSEDGQARAVLGRGCRGFIQKPFTVEELSRRVREILTAHEGKHPRPPHGNMET